MSTRIYPLLVLIFTLCACTTPPVVLRQADHGLFLTAQLRQEFDRYAARQAAVDSMRRQQIIGNRSVADLELTDQVADQQLYEASGQGRALMVMKNLQTRIILLDQSSLARKAGIKQIEEMTSPVVVPSLALDDNLAVTGNAFGALGTELPFAERLELAASAFRQVNEIVHKSRAADGVIPADELEKATQSKNASTTQ